MIIWRFQLIYHTWLQHGMKPVCLKAKSLTGLDTAQAADHGNLSGMYFRYRHEGGAIQHFDPVCFFSVTDFLFRRKGAAGNAYMRALSFLAIGHTEYAGAEFFRPLFFFCQLSDAIQQFFNAKVF